MCWVGDDGDDDDVGGGERDGGNGFGHLIWDGGVGVGVYENQ